MDNLPRSRTPPRWTSAWRRPGSCGPAVGDITDCSAAALVPAAPLAVIAATGGGANGVFVDGCHHVALANCQYSTCGEDGASCCHVSPHAELEFNQVTWSLATCHVRHEPVCRVWSWLWRSSRRSLGLAAWSLAMVSRTTTSTRATATPPTTCLWMLSMDFVWNTSWLLKVT